MENIKNYKWKSLNIILLLVGLLFIIVSQYFLSSICLEIGDCVDYTRRGTWNPLFNAGIVFSVISLLFLFIPQNYFKRYFTHWFWWLFLIAYAISASTDPVGDGIMQYDRSQVVMMLGVIGLVQALIFIFLHHRKSKKSV